MSVALLEPHWQLTMPWMNVLGLITVPDVAPTTGLVVSLSELSSILGIALSISDGLMGSNAGDTVVIFQLTHLPETPSILCRTLKKQRCQ